MQRRQDVIPVSCREHTEVRFNPQLLCRGRDAVGLQLHRLMTRGLAVRRWKLSQPRWKEGGPARWLWLRTKKGLKATAPADMLEGRLVVLMVSGPLYKKGLQ